MTQLKKLSSLACLSVLHPWAVCYTLFMLRMRRTLAFSARIHNYLLLLYLFSFALYVSQLWWETTGRFGTLVGTMHTTLAAVSLGHAAVLLVMSLFIWIVDRVFPAWDFFGTILRSFVIGTCQVLVALHATVSDEGLALRLFGG